MSSNLRMTCLWVFLADGQVETEPFGVHLVDLTLVDQDEKRNKKIV